MDRASQVASSVVKNPPVNVGDVASKPGSGRSPGKGNGNQLQYSWVESPMDREVWWATVQGFTRVGHNSVTKQQQQQCI